jgi:hypothetical protein
MSEYTERFWERRQGKDRRDWDEFIVYDRRLKKERRSGKDRRRNQKPFIVAERRRLRKSFETITTPTHKRMLRKQYYAIQEVARKTGVPVSTIITWLREKVINDVDIHRDVYGRRAFTEDNIKHIIAIKKSKGLK